MLIEIVALAAVGGVRWPKLSPIVWKRSAAFRLRETMGFKGYGSQKKFADYLGITGDSWNHFERGYAPLSKGVAILLVQKCPGVTLDWLLLGKIEGLTLRMARALGNSLVGHLIY